MCFDNSPLIKLRGLMLFALLVMASPNLAFAQSSEHWEVEFYGGHFGVPNAVNSADHLQKGPNGVAGNAPVLYGSGVSADSLTYSFNDTDIQPLSTDPGENPWNVLAATLASSTVNPVTGAYPDTNSSGAYSFIFRRTAPFAGTIQIGEAGGYFDDFAELFINGVLVDSINQFTNSLPASDVIFETVQPGDVIEARFTNGASLGGFQFQMAFAPPPGPHLTIDKANPSLTTDADGSGSITLGDTLTYTVTVTNTGAADLTNVLVSDPLLTPSSASCATVVSFDTCVLSGTHIVSLAEANAGIVTNTASVTSVELPPTNSTTVATAVVPTADFSIRKTNSPGTHGDTDQANDIVTSGSLTSYTLTVTNHGPLSLSGVVVNDTPVAGLTCPATNAVTIAGSGVPSGSFTIADLTGPGITLGTLADGESTTLSFTCQVN